MDILVSSPHYLPMKIEDVVHIFSEGSMLRVISQKYTEPEDRWKNCFLCDFPCNVERIDAEEIVAGKTAVMYIEDLETDRLLFRMADFIGSVVESITTNEEIRSKAWNLGAKVSERIRVRGARR